MIPIAVTPAKERKPKPADESQLSFGTIFTDHMFVVDYAPEQGWYDARIVPYAPFAIDPAWCVLHYCQTVFEGMKCYRRDDGGLQLFRPRDNFARMNRSAERICMPQIDVELAMQGLAELIKLDADWVPGSPGTSLYIRPTLIATDNMLGVHASRTYRFFIILSPVGAYYAEGLAPVKIYVESEYVRAVPGGVGFTKTGGNYAASILAGAVAEEKGYAQVLWLDGRENKYIEEVGSMNMFFKIGGTLVTPALNGSILSGITRDSVLTLAKDMGVPTEERRLAMAEVFQDAKNGSLEEAFGSGTAAVISPVGGLTWNGESVELSGGEIGPLTQQLYDQLTGIQYGRVPDPHDWIVKIS